MMKIWTCRRSSIAVIAIAALTSIAIYKGMDTSSAIAAIALGIAGANAYQGSKGASNG